MTQTDPSRQPSTLTIVSGDSSDRLVVPDLSPIGSTPVRMELPPEPLRLAYYARPRHRFDWRVFAAVIATGAFATAGGLTAAKYASHADVSETDTTSSILSEIPQMTAYSDAARALSGSRTAASMGRATATLLSRNATPRARPAPVVNASHSAPAARQPEPNVPTPSRANCVQTCAGNVDCILHCPYQGVEAGHGMQLSAPTAQQVELALQSVRGAVMVCGMGVPNAPATVHATITFGSNGAPQSIDLGGPFDGTGPGSCIQRAIRRAHVPAFSDSTFRTRYTFAVQ
jgi:hypothetical protein